MTRILRRARLSVGLLLVLTTVALVLAADLSVTVLSLSSPVAPFSDATLEAQTTPGAACAITVRYKSGPSRAKGLLPKTADAQGRVLWRWRVGSSTTPGHWPIEVTCEKGDVKGTLQTSFEVR